MMNMHQPILWEDLAWSDLPGVLEACGSAVIWPFGATEQHGPHLGCGVDSVIAREVCAAVSTGTRVPVLPVLSIGCSSGHSRKWPGTLSLTPTTLIRIIEETGDWLYSSGVRRLFLVNAHVTNAAPLRCGLESLRARFDDLMVVLVNTPEISGRVREAFFADAEDWHANAAETSLMQYLRPEAVVADRVSSVDDPDRTVGMEFAHPVNHTSANGVTGFPSRASKEEGEALFRMMVEDLSLHILKGCNETRPL